MARTKTKKQTKAPTPRKRPAKKAAAPAKPKAKRKPPKGKPPKATGRPRKIDQHVKVFDPKTKRYKTLTVGDAVVLMLEQGTTVETAAGAVGIGRSTVHDWVAKGEEFREAESPPKDQQVFVDFSDAVTRAREKVVSIALAGIIEAGKADWRAFAWFLERSRPDEYGRRTRLDHGGVGGDGEKLTLAELIARAASDPSTASDADDPKP